MQLETAIELVLLKDNSKAIATWLERKRVPVCYAILGEKYLPSLLRLSKEYKL